MKGASLEVRPGADDRRRAGIAVVVIATMLVLYLGFLQNPVPMGVPFLTSASSVRIALVLVSPVAVLMAAAMSTTLLSLLLGGPWLQVTNGEVELKRPPRSTVRLSCAEIADVGPVRRRRVRLNALESEMRFAVLLSDGRSVAVAQVAGGPPLEFVRTVLVDCSEHGQHLGNH